MAEVKPRLIEMTAAERKAEAMDLIDNGERLSNYHGRLDGLTNFQVRGQYAPYPVSYETDADACLKLLLPDETCRWELYPSGAADESHGAIITGKGRVTLTAHTSMKSLPLAMLRAWWSIQEPE